LIAISVLVVQGQVPDALRQGRRTPRPIPSREDHPSNRFFEREMECHRSAMARGGKGTRRAGVLAVFEHRAKVRTTLQSKSEIGINAPKTPSPSSRAAAMPFGPAAPITIRHGDRARRPVARGMKHPDDAALPFGFLARRRARTARTYSRT